MNRRAFLSFVPAVLGSACLAPTIVQAEDDAKTKKVFVALDQQTALELSDTSLKDLAGLISQLYDIPVKVNKEELAKIGLDEKLTLTCNVKGKRLKQILSQILPEAHEKLTYEVKDGALWFTIKK